MPISETGTRTAKRPEALARSRPPRSHGVHSSRVSGFTLVEMMAVVAIMALVLSMMLPTLGAARGAALRRNARELSGVLELARQRSVMTGKPHRVTLDLDSGSYGLDWYETTPVVEEPPDLSGARPISLEPPEQGEADFQPVPGHFGALTRLDEDFVFEGVETVDGWVEEGSVSVVFDRDGTTDSAEIYLVDESGLSVSLSIRPLQEYVRIREDALRDAP